MTHPSETGTAAIDTFLALWEARRDPFAPAPGEGLPPADADLAALVAPRVGDPDADPAEAPPFRSDFHRKRHALRRAFTGQSELAFLNAFLIAHLRKRSWPDEAPVLFRRIWAEQAGPLLDSLDPRWLVSSMATFGDHGATPRERSLGLSLHALFSTMKIYESERLYSGFPPERAFAIGDMAKATLPLEMDGVSLTSSGIDANLLARLWSEASEDAVAGPLARALLERVVEDERSVFRRLATMRQRRARKIESDRSGPLPNVAPAPFRAHAQDAQALRWGLVATAKAPAAAILRFVAHHLDCGATGIRLYLDAPNPEAEARLGAHPRVTTIRCDDAYWQARGVQRPEEHQLRQVVNATHAMEATADTFDWIGHVDVDEMLLPARPVAEALAALRSGIAVARMVPAELLSRRDGTVRHFKLPRNADLHGRDVLRALYPTFGDHLEHGFLSHTNGKIFVRTGIPDAKLGIHRLRWQGRGVTNRALLAGVHVGHLHAPSFEAFRAHLDFRRARGCYRPKRRDRAPMPLHELLDFLSTQEGDAGLRQFYDEVCSDRDDLRATLAAQGLLLSHPLDLEGALARHFPDAA